MKYYFLLFIYFIFSINTTDYKILEADTNDLDWSEINTELTNLLKEEENGEFYTSEINQDPKGLKISYKKNDNEVPELVGKVTIVGGLLKDDELVRIEMEINENGQKFMTTEYNSIGKLMDGIDEEDEDYLGYLINPIAEYLSMTIMTFHGNENFERIREGKEDIDISQNYQEFIQNLESSFNGKGFKQSEFDIEKGEIVEGPEIKVNCESLSLGGGKRYIYDCKAENNLVVKIIYGEVEKENDLWKVTISHFGEDFNYFWTDKMITDSEKFKELVDEFLVSLEEYEMYSPLRLEDFTNLVNYKLENLEIHALGEKENQIGTIKDNCERIVETKEELVSPVCDYFINSYHDQEGAIPEEKNDETKKRNLKIAKKNLSPKIIINKKSKFSMVKKVYYEKINRNLSDDKYCPIANSQIKTSLISIENFHYYFLKLEFIQFKQEHYIAFQKGSDISEKIDSLYKDLQEDIDHWVLNKKKIEDTEEEVENEILGLDFYKKLVSDQLEEAGVEYENKEENDEEKTIIFLNSEHRRMIKISELDNDYLRFNFYYTSEQKKMNDIREEVTVKRDKQYNQDFYLLKNLAEFIEVQKKEKKIL